MKVLVLLTQEFPFEIQILKIQYHPYRFSLGVIIQNYIYEFLFGYSIVHSHLQRNLF